MLLLLLVEDFSKDSRAVEIKLALNSGSAAVIIIERITAITRGECSYAESTFSESRSGTFGDAGLPLAIILLVFDILSTKLAVLNYG
jgi:hypothetical protein